MNANFPHRILESSLVASTHTLLNMFSRVALFALLALPTFSLATPLVARGDGGVQCCNNVEKVHLDVNYAVEFANASFRLGTIAQIR
jgi:hypothetical protein